MNIQRLPEPARPERRLVILVDREMLLADPHAAFARLREEHPVIELCSGEFLALAARDVLALPTDPRTRQIEGVDFVRMRGIPQGSVARFLEDVFLLSNDRDHREKRSLFARAFSYPTVQRLRCDISAVARSLAAGLPRGEVFEFGAHMSSRLPAEVLVRFLGLPASDTRFFSRHVIAVAPALSPDYPICEHDEIEASASALYEYIELQLVERLTAPREDLLTRFADLWHRDGTIPFESLVHQVLAIILGGIDTTRASLSMALALLLRHPEEWRALQADLALLTSAVSEALRFEPAVASVPRQAVADLTLSGIQIPAGSMISASTMSAMRDPRSYLSPDRFRVRRPEQPRLHPVFGAGPHRCIGEMLARIQLEEGLAAVISTAPGIELVTAPKMTGFAGLRQISPMFARID